MGNQNDTTLSLTANARMLFADHDGFFADNV